MNTNENKTLSPKAVKVCLTPKEALAVAEPCLKDLGEISRDLLVKEKADVKAYEYKKVFIWVVSIAATPQASNKRLALYVVVKTSEVKAEVINIKNLKPLENKRMIKANGGTFWYAQGVFSPLKYGNIMTRTQCNALWQQAKTRYIRRLEADSYVIYERPVPAIDRQTPLYIIAFRPISYKIEALVVYPNQGIISTHVYQKAIWRKMLRKTGMSIVKGNLEITIAPEGFVTTMKMR